MVMKIHIIAVLSLILIGCAGSPARVTFQSVEEIYQQNLAELSPKELCDSAVRMRNERDKTNVYREAHRKAGLAVNLAFDKLELPHNYCENQTSYRYSRDWDRKDYNIDGLLIVKETAKNTGHICANGGKHKITLKGFIGPDSSFAIDKILETYPACSNADGNVISPVEVRLESAGGLIKDGYSLGRSLRKYEASTVIEDDKICASSCAVAFLGGRERNIEHSGTILFHAPYYNRLNAMGEEDPDCDVETATLNGLQDYYVEMTDKEIGGRLFERTMWYCSTDNGWTITGGGAADLYGIGSGV